LTWKWVAKRRIAPTAIRKMLPAKVIFVALKDATEEIDGEQDQDDEDEDSDDGQDELLGWFLASYVGVKMAGPKASISLSSWMALQGLKREIRQFVRGDQGRIAVDLPFRLSR
jgi:hypothetical protein